MLKYFVLGAALAAASSAARAEDGSFRYVSYTGAGGEASTQNSLDLGGPSFLDKVYLNLFTVYHGAAMNNPLSPYTVGAAGTQTSQGIYFDNEVTASYMVTPDIGVGPDIPFLFSPVMGKGFALGDLGVKAFDKTTYAYKGFSLYTNLLLQAPTSAWSQAHNMSFAVKMTPYVRYAIPGSRFALGSWTEEKAYFGVSSDKTFKLYAAPYVSYTLFPKVSLNLEWEVEAHHNVGDTGVFAFEMYESDLEPGIIWMITPKILFNPYVAFYTTNNFSADRSALGAVISITAL